MHGYFNKSSLAKEAKRSIDGGSARSNALLHHFHEQVIHFAKSVPAKQPINKLVIPLPIRDIAFSFLLIRDELQCSIKPPSFNETMDPRTIHITGCKLINDLGCLSKTSTAAELSDDGAGGGATGCFSKRQGVKKSYGIVKAGTAAEALDEDACSHRAGGKVAGKGVGKVVERRIDEGVEEDPR
jgi:hypothetical protein